MMLAITRLSLLAAGLTLSIGAGAAPNGVSTKTEYYRISGSTGAQLYASMVSRSPRGGLTSRMIARTFYGKLDWQMNLEPRNGNCRVVSARPALAITYTYPKPSTRLPPALQRRWSRFITAIRRHEENHGRIAREMVAAAAKSVRGLEVQGDASCSRTRAEIIRRATEMRRLYEARQIEFDKVEHKGGGNIGRLILALVD